MQTTRTLRFQWFFLPSAWPLLCLPTFRSQHRYTVILACIHLRDGWTTKTTTSDRTACVGEAPVNVLPLHNPQNHYVSVGPACSGRKSFPAGSRKSRKGPICFCMSVRPSVRPSVLIYQFVYYWTDFRKYVTGDFYLLLSNNPKFC
jgi:hypothetical protein